MAATCATCGAKLGLGERLRGETKCTACEARAREQTAAGLREYESSALQIVQAPDPMAEAGRLPAIATRAGLTDQQVSYSKQAAMQSLVARILEDEHLTEPEEQRIEAALSALGFDVRTVLTQDPVLRNRLLIARFNAGRLLELPASDIPIILKRGEVAHWVSEASLLKEVVHREMRGSYRGVSIPIAKGIRFHTGGSRGRSVVVGTSLAVADTGNITVTSTRVVYKGMRKTVETQYSKLIGVNVFDDGIQFHASNRQSAPLFRVPDGHILAAAVNAAAQRLA